MLGPRRRSLPLNYSCNEGAQGLSGAPTTETAGSTVPSSVQGANGGDGRSVLNEIGRLLPRPVVSAGALHRKTFAERESIPALRRSTRQRRAREAPRRYGPPRVRTALT
jgi:hypothetical protein